MVTAIPYHVEINRVIELLASQIYQSPLALLRDNCQNAYDAILERMFREPEFTDPRIVVDIAEDRIRVSDNGIGMSPQDLDSHYWRAGSSGKNNPESRAAGVVGTFGIGAMANFGVASELFVTTESFNTGQRTKSSVERAKLSATEPCILIEALPSEKDPGTTIEIVIDEWVNLDVAQAIAYSAEAVRYLPIPVFVNGNVVSMHEFVEDLPQPRNPESTFRQSVSLARTIEATVELATGFNAEPWVRVTDMSNGSDAIAGEIILAQDRHQIHAFRSGFSLATTGVQSYFGLGGIANLATLTPTAGRDSLASSSIQFLQTLVTGLDRLIAEHLGTLGASDNNTKFMEWVRKQPVMVTGLTCVTILRSDWNPELGLKL